MGETERANLVDGRRKDVFRLWKCFCGKSEQQSPQNCLGRPTMQLLMGDGPNETLVR